MLSAILSTAGSGLAQQSRSTQLAMQGTRLAESGAESKPELRTVFDQFVGQTFYGQMLSAMRKTVDKPAYFHGGHAEEVFQAQLDQTLSEHLAEATASQFTGPMFELFNLPRR